MGAAAEFLAQLMCEKFAGDSIAEMHDNYNAYMARVRDRSAATQA